MTAIVAVVDKGKVWMGGDSAGSNSNWDLSIRSDPKVFRVGEFLLGFTSSFRMGQLLQFSLTPPPIKEDGDLFRYMATDFIDAVRKCLKDGGYATKDKEQESGGHFLVGVRGNLYHVQGDYQVAIPADGYCAVGCGDAYAKGVFYATRGKPPKQRIQLALEAAERHSAGVRGPFVILGPEKR